MSTLLAALFTPLLLQGVLELVHSFLVELNELIELLIAFWNLSKSFSIFFESFLGFFLSTGFSKFQEYFLLFLKLFDLDWC